jgi:hypothetical protein
VKYVLLGFNSSAALFSLSTPTSRPIPIKYDLHKPLKVHCSTTVFSAETQLDELRCEDILQALAFEYRHMAGNSGK